MSVFLRPPRFDQPAPSEITPRLAYEGRRDWLRDYCETQKVRYVRRPDNKGSKANPCC